MIGTVAVELGWRKAVSPYPIPILNGAGYVTQQLILYGELTRKYDHHQGV